jgi:uncharacterized membrane protein YfcA
MLGFFSHLDLSASSIAIILLAGFVGGIVNATAGGGGLITIPTLTLLGLNPIQAIATDKIQVAVGMAASSLNFWQKGLLSIRSCAYGLLYALAGGTWGATLLQFVHVDALYHLLPWLILGLAAYVAFFGPGEKPSPARMNIHQYAHTWGLAIGFYDGCFGPATATLFTTSIASWLGKDLRQSTAYAKAANLASAFGASVVYLLGGDVMLWISLLLCIGQIAGAWLGSNLVVYRGTRFVRFCLISVSIAMATRLFWLSWYRV